MPENDDLLLNRMRQRGDNPHQIKYRYDEGIKERALLERLSKFYRDVYIINPENFATIVRDIETKHPLERTHRAEFIV